MKFRFFGHLFKPLAVVLEKIVVVAGIYRNVEKGSFSFFLFLFTSDLQSRLKWVAFPVPMVVLVPWQLLLHNTKAVRFTCTALASRSDFPIFYDLTKHDLCHRCME